MKLKWDEVEIEQREFKDFAKVPFGMAEGKHNVSGSAIRLYVVYYSFSRPWIGTKPKKIKESISQAAFAKKLEVTPKTVSILTKELYNKGWIDVERTGRNLKITLRGKSVRFIND